MKKIRRWRKPAQPTSTSGVEAVVIPRDDHTLSRADVSEHALKVLYRLGSEGFDAYLVGGGVRDVLLGLHPKDFDIATDASPEEVKKAFHNCRLIGRRFRLAHVFFGREIIEVATFRAGASKQVHHSHQRHGESGMLVRDNVYGNIEEDAMRRDFTVNALYYSAKDFTILDYTDGMSDLKQRQIRMIGDPVQRYHEDPVRMLRAVRFAAKLDFTIESATEAPIPELVGLIQNVPAARLFDEILKWFCSGKSFAAFEMLRHYGLFSVLFPQTETDLAGSDSETPYEMLAYGFKNTDTRIAENKSLNPAYLFSVLLWWPLQKRLRHFGGKAGKIYPPLILAMQSVLKQQVQQVTIPRRISAMIKEIWVLQYRLVEVRPKQVYRTFQHPRFRAAYDFLVLRAQAGEDVQQWADWWTTFQDVSTDQRHEMVQVLDSGRKSSPRRRKRTRKPRKAQENL